jgi:hypothetical protein
MRGGRRWSTVTVAAVVVGLAAIVLASRGLPGDRTTAAFSAAFDDRLLLVLFVLVVGGGTALVIWSAWPDGEREFVRPKTSWWRQYLLSLIMLLVFVLVGAARERAMNERERGGRLELTADPADDPAGTTDDGDRVPPSATATLAIGVTVTALAVAAVGRALARRRAEALGLGAAVASADGRGGRPTDEDLPPLPDGFDETDLAAEPDHRRAVQLAYAMLERRLAGTPSARPLSATPGEWLAVLRRADPATAAAARRLTALYEQARFGGDTHPVTSEQRDEALDALRTLTSAAGTSTSTGGRGL